MFISRQKAFLALCLMESGKTPIAVVVYKSSDGKCGQAMALNSVNNGKRYDWEATYEYVNISGLPDLSLSEASKDYASCENSEKIRAHGDSSIHPAVWQAYNYTTTGTKVGDWCLPAAGIFISIYNNQSTINIGFIRAGGGQNSQPALGRRPSTITTTRGSHSLTTVSACTTSISTLNTRSAPSLSFRF